MKEIKILGSGCAKCSQLADVVKAVIETEGIEASMEKVEDVQAIMAYEVLSTPALVVDGEVRSKGRIPSYDEIKEILTTKKHSCCCGGASHGSNGKNPSGCCS